MDDTQKNDTLIILAHPQFHMSNINKVLIKTAIDGNLADVMDLYEVYPDMFVDTETEQKRLSSYDNIILQFPFQWYSCPALLKEWIDSVFHRGWAFDGGDELKDKNLSCVITTGGTKYSYSKRGHNRFTINDYLTPFDQTAHICGMNYSPAYVVYKAHHLDDEEIKKYCADYAALLEKLNTKSAAKAKESE